MKFCKNLGCPNNRIIWQSKENDPREIALVCAKCSKIRYFSDSQIRANRRFIYFVGLFLFMSIVGFVELNTHIIEKNIGYFFSVNNQSTSNLEFLIQAYVPQKNTCSGTNKQYLGEYVSILKRDQSTVIVVLRKNNNKRIRTVGRVNISEGKIYAFNSSISFIKEDGSIYLYPSADLTEFSCTKYLPIK